MKIPPNDLMAEQAVLGCILLENNAITTALDKLTPEYFYGKDNSIIFEAMMNLINNNKNIDILTVTDELKSMNSFEKVGGYDYLALLPDKVPTTSNLEQYIDILVEKYNMRQIITTGNDMISLRI